MADFEPSELGAATHKLMLAASVLGYFDPASFGQTLVVEGERHASLAALVPLCHEIKSGDKYHWSMNPDDRRAVLATLQDFPDYENLLREVTPATGDAFGEYVIRGLLGENLVKLAPSVENKSELLRAARLVESTLGSHLTDKVAPANAGTNGHARQIRQQIARDEAQEILKTAIPPELFGRASDYDKLVRYCSISVKQPIHGPLILMVVTGVGGVGKSALVSKFIYDQRALDDTAPIVYFDFDRSSLVESDPMELTFEFSRQIGLFDPSLDATMSNFRRLQREVNPALSNFESGSRALVGALTDLRALFASWAYRDKPVTLVLDTFEEVALRGNTLVLPIIDWLVGLRDIAGLSNLHIIISGRELPEDVFAGEQSHVWHWMKLTDLDAEPARQMLHSLGVNEEIAAQAVAAFGGNPLVMRMFSRFAKNHPEKVSGLLEEGRQSRRSAPVGELAMQFLYERILNRIEDKRVRALAHPGLILRRITPDLIHRVLALPCDLEPLSAEEAQDLFHRLAEHVWLVRSESSRVLSHRRDLRRLMLPGIQAAYGKKFAAIHKSAVRYYSSGTADLSKAEARIETLYHLGFITDSVPFASRSEARQVINTLGVDLTDWPVTARAQAKSKAKLYSNLTTEELATLSGEDAQRSRSARVTTILKQGMVDEAQTEYDSSVYKAISIGEDGVLNPAELELAYANGRFRDVNAHPEVAIATFFAPRIPFRGNEIWWDKELISGAPWLAALSRLSDTGDTAPRSVFSDEFLDEVCQASIYTIICRYSRRIWLLRARSTCCKPV